MIKAIWKKWRCVGKMTFRDLVYNIHHYNARNTGTTEQDFATLRMLCHMLDKGLNNVHFERGHSHSIYVQAQALYVKLVCFYADDPAFIWTGEVLKTYEQAQKEGKVKLEERLSKVYDEREQHYIEDFITSRVSCRNFTGEVILENEIKDIIRLAVDAPNGCCRQTVRFYLTQNPEKISRLVPCIAGITNFTNIPCLACVVAESAFYDLKDKNLQYVDASLAAENLILAARLYNIYGTMCNFFHATPSQVDLCKSLLGIKDSENIVMFIALGYPSRIPQKPVRREINKFYKIVD